MYYYIFLDNTCAVLGLEKNIYFTLVESKLAAWISGIIISGHFSVGSHSLDHERTAGLTKNKLNIIVWLKGIEEITAINNR